MIYFKTNGTEYPADIIGKNQDREWDSRASKAVTLGLTYAQAAQIFVDGLAWSIVQREDVPIYGEDGLPTGETTETMQEWDNSDYCVAGPITDNRDGTCTCKMGTYTELETALRQIGEAMA